MKKLINYLKEYAPVVTAVVFCGLLVLGWVVNIIWTFGADTIQEVILGAVGIFLFPIGVIHGLWVLL